MFEWHTVVWFHDESTFYANNQHKSGWVHSSEIAVPYTKEEGPSQIVADVVSAGYEWLCSPDGKQEASLQSQEELRWVLYQWWNIGACNQGGGYLGWALCWRRPCASFCRCKNSYQAYRWGFIQSFYAKVYVRIGSRSQFSRTRQETCLWTWWQADEAQDQNVRCHICRWFTSIIVFWIQTTGRSTKRNDCSSRAGLTQRSRPEGTVSEV